MLNLLSVLGWTVHRDLLLALRRPGDALGPAGFFLLACALFPLGVGPQASLLRAIAPGVLWVAALLAGSLALGRLFAQDHADGTLEQLLVNGQPLAWLVLGKVLAHWLSTGVPLLLLAPLLGLQFGLPADALGVLVLALLLGTPVLSLVGGIGAALTLGVRGGGVLVALLVLPLQVPVLVFGAGAVVAQTSGGTGMGAHLMLLGAVLLASLALAPLATAAALRVSLA